MNEIMTPALADYRARCFVNGSHRHAKSQTIEPISGAFSARFLNHPWVRESIVEGWDRELRAHLVRVVRARLMRLENLPDIDELMPPRDWVEKVKPEAARYAAAAAWRDKKYGPIDYEAVDRQIKRMMAGAA